MMLFGQARPNNTFRTGKDRRDDRKFNLVKGSAAHLNAEALLHLDDAPRNRVLNQRTRIVSTSRSDSVFASALIRSFQGERTVPHHTSYYILCLALPANVGRKACGSVHPGLLAFLIENRQQNGIDITLALLQCTAHRSHVLFLEPKNSTFLQDEPPPAPLLQDIT